jgi:hypothetical protein
MHPNPREMNPGIKAFISPTTATTPQLDELEGKNIAPL